MVATKFEIRSYSNNGASWGWNGDGWDAAGETATDALHNSAVSGDWSAYAVEEECKIVAFDSEGEEIDSLIFSPHNSTCDQCGASGLEYGDLLSLANGTRICGKCEHAAETK